jgi:hypothetical protein
MRLLKEFSQAKNGPTLEHILEAFIRPSLEVTVDHHGRSNFTRLRAILSGENSALLEKLIADNFDQSSRTFVHALRKCLPHLKTEDVLWRFHFRRRAPPNPRAFKWTMRSIRPDRLC